VDAGADIAADADGAAPRHPFQWRSNRRRLESLMPQVTQPVRRRTPDTTRPPRQKFPPAVPRAAAASPDGSAISQAVSEVTQVVESLKEASIKWRMFWN